ncbi:hypothetical protein TWF730_008892 [Orbilia blumenaviensis]|uniref:Uncharacterized protein n=1 Tax=Orbilia blumenaviensis TaxID=1796055 RepID=A0AAV9V6W8_9PEZI
MTVNTFQEAPGIRDTNKETSRPSCKVEHVEDAEDEKGNDLKPNREDEEWRKSLFDLTSSFPSQQVPGGLLVGAGLINCLVLGVRIRINARNLPSM